MQSYRYKAMNSRGERLESTYAANSKEEVIEMISSNNYYPLMVEEVKKGFSISVKSLKKITTKDIAVLCRQFYTMLDAGASITSSIHILSEQHTNPRLRGSLIKIEEELRKGETLSQAMKSQKGDFPDLLISLIEAGEISGTMDVIMNRMSVHYEKENKINNKIKNAMIYPVILGVVAIAVVSFILAFVMPVFVSMFESSGVELPLSTEIVLSLSRGLKQYWWFILIFILAAAFGIKNYVKTDKGRFLLDSLKLKLPIIKKLNEKIIVSRFTRTLATVIASGISVVSGLQIVSEVVGNKAAEEKLLKVKEELIKGEGLSKPLRETDIFPPMLSSMVSIGEESGALDDILNKTADFYDEELDSEIQNFTTLLEPLMIAVMGIILGLMIISIIQPMFGMYNTM
ncbi:type II secretion system F family protein [Clostridium polynesiense]|uniref:type II secretion system F family protein n=1 Tax=Clostridium polynesiense TaxID=1325933 RepID=UPI00059106D0|nr:type II secretion system F family protein [Clostridium polynesiense]